MHFSAVQMLLFYQRGRILHFSRSFSIFRQGSYHFSLYPIFPPSFSEFSLPFFPLFPSSNPVSSISCAVPEFSPPLPSRTLEKGTFLQSAVTVSSSIASQEALLELCRSSTQALPQLLSYSYYAGLWLLCKHLSSSYIPPEGNTIIVALHCVALYSTTASCPIVPALRYIIGRRDILKQALHSLLISTYCLQCPVFASECPVLAFYILVV